MTEKEMIELAREEKNRYKREWYHKNKEHVREYYKRYRKENAERLKNNEMKRWANRALKRREAEKESEEQ